MKIFNFIGKTLEHTETFIDSVAGAVVSGSDTLGVFAETAKLNALVEQTASVAETKLECKIRLMDLQQTILNMENGVDVDRPAVTEKSVTDLINSL